MYRHFIVIAAFTWLFGCSTISKVSKQSFSDSKNTFMKENFYTHALWHVKDGKTGEFIAAWKKFGNTLAQIPDSPPAKGTLIQSLSDSLIFYSFGPWENMEDINAMRNNENVKKALADIISLCHEAKPGSYRTVAQLSFPGTRHN